MKVRRKKLTKNEKRMDELDQLFIRLYENNVGGKISDKRFALMISACENAQAVLRT